MEGLLLGDVAAELDKDRQRLAEKARRFPRASRKPRRPSGTWVLSGSIAPWLGY